LREQLKLLEELQRHDARLQELEALAQSLPQKLRAVELAIDEMEKLLAKERADLAETEAFKRGQEGEHKDMNEQLGRAKVKLQQVKNLKESGAAQREVETTRRMLETREEEVKKLTDLIDQQRQKVNEHEAKLSADRHELSEQKQNVERRIADLKQQVSEAKVLRDEVAKQLRPDVLKKYGTIRLRRGLAVVAVKDGTCRGCNMNIPPQLYNTIQRGSSLELCPNCHRIIYWSKLLEGDGQPEGPNGQSTHGQSGPKSVPPSTGEGASSNA
jgi:hypothetical protein